jgi:hypothetical protein
MRVLRPLRLGLPAGACALAGHAVVYGTFWPAGGAHGYFGWYQPLLGGISALALLSLAALLVVGLAGSPRARRLLEGLVTRQRATPVVRAHRLAITSLAILLLQESLEASLASGRPALGAFSGPVILLVVTVIWLLSFGLVFAARSYERFAGDAVARGGIPRHAAGAVTALPTAPSLRPRNPLADFRGLRAPPLTA